MIGDGLQKLPERIDLSAMTCPASRQIYLTFPADSRFREEDVSDYFSTFGPVQDVRIPYQQKRMFGFVTFVYPETVKSILAKGNPHFVCDSRVLVKPYKEKGKVPDKYRTNQATERELSPTGLDSSLREAIGKSESNPTNASDTTMFLKDPLLLRRLSSAASLTHSFLQSNDLFLPPSHSLRLESLLSSLPISPSPTTCPSAATWFHRFLSSALEDDDPRWLLCFRMSRSTFFHLYSILSPSLPSFAAAIFRLAHAASYESLVHRFGFDSTAEASRAFFTVCKLIHEKLGHLDDPKPDFLPRLLLNCCGVVGFERFEVEGKLLGANGSLIVQALVDSNGRFADISAGWPSTMKPEAIFRQTKLFSAIEETESRRFLNGAPTKLGNGILVPRYILGDSRLPLLPWLMTPYNPSSNEEDDSFESSLRREFDNVVYTALHTVETAFGKVRARWRILDKKWKPETLEFLPFVLTTGCLLHNFLVNSGEDDSPDELANAAPAKMWKVEKGEEEETRISQGEAFVNSKRIRDAIAENLSQVQTVL